MRNNTSILVLLALALCGSDAAAQGTVAKTHSGACITEVLADNRTGLRDADGLAVRVVDASFLASVGVGLLAMSNTIPVDVGAILDAVEAERGDEARW